jgi:plastocyanin
MGFGVTDEPALRSRLFAACAVCVALLLAAPASAATFEVRAVMSENGAEVYFDPVGLRIQPGDTVRWIQVNGYHSVTAYHPANGDHELRIPERAEPWDSGMLLAEYPAKGSTFEHTFTIRASRRRDPGRVRSATHPTGTGSPCRCRRSRPFRPLR